MGEVVGDGLLASERLGVKGSVARDDDAGPVEVGGEGGAVVELGVAVEVVVERDVEGQAAGRAQEGEAAEAKGQVAASAKGQLVAGAVGDGAVVRTKVVLIGGEISSIIIGVGPAVLVEAVGVKTAFELKVKVGVQASVPVEAGRVVLVDVLRAAERANPARGIG